MKTTDGVTRFLQSKGKGPSPKQGTPKPIYARQHQSQSHAQQCGANIVYNRVHPYPRLVFRCGSESRALRPRDSESVVYGVTRRFYRGTRGTLYDLNNENTD